MSQPISKYNPQYINKDSLSKATFHYLSLLMEVDICEFCPREELENNTWYSWQLGYLLDDLGPCKKGTYVMLTNKGDKVTLSLPNKEDNGYIHVFVFYVILQKPVIVEPMKKVN